VKVQKFPFGLRVFTANGYFYDGDLVVGADGVHSRIRSEMWKIGDDEHPGLITSAEKNGQFYGIELYAGCLLKAIVLGMYADYAGVFGISAAVPCLVGQNFLSMHNGLAIIAGHLENERIGWLVMQKLDKRCYFPNIPRFTQHDASNLCERLRRKKLPGGAKFEDIWVRKERFSMVALEENLFQTWHFDRIVCLGDSMHKVYRFLIFPSRPNIHVNSPGNQVTPVLALGASCAMESAAALANSLHDLTSGNHIQKPSDAQLHSVLHAYSDARMSRVKKIVRLDAFAARLVISHRTMSKIVSRYLLPHFMGLVADLLSDIVVGGVLLNYERSPKRPGGQEWQPGRLRLLLIFVINAFFEIPIL
jgi:FAD dependent monooxygenase